MKKLKHQHLTSGLFAAIFLSNVASAKVSNVESSKVPKKKTVGELLASARNKGAGVKFNATKTYTSLPSASLGFKGESAVRNLESVKPPRSTEIMQNTAGPANGQAEYENVLNQQIRELYKLTQKFKNSPNRGELWLRLAELYVEKASLVDARKQDEYDAQLAAFQSGKIKNKPSLDVAEAREYNKRAVQLYEWFERDFPNDEKMSQALFFLGYNYFELAQTEKGVQYYDALTKRFPNSPFVGESHFALGEYYFDLEKWAEAYKQYSYLIKLKNHRLHNFALYKGSWCLFRLNKFQQAMGYLEYLIKHGKAEVGGNASVQKKVNSTRLEGEALRDIVVFYAEGGDPAKAEEFFKELVGDNYQIYLERLAHQYSERGYKEQSHELYKRLISINPLAPKNFEFQYQVVQNYFYAKNIKRFKIELYSWVKDYGQSSAWYDANKGNKELIQNSEKLRETTLRNYVLQQHQTAQNSRAKYSQEQAYEAYQIYLGEFSKSAVIGDMHFYFGELLFDMEKFDEATVQYKWVVDNTPQNKFFDKAAQNLILSFERSMPTDQEMQKRVGDSLEPLPLDPKIDQFIKAARWYVDKFPNSEKTVEMKFRIGRLYYQNNYFDEAAKIFQDIVKKHPSTKYAEYSANLLLDIYNLKKDYAGLAKVGADLLAVPGIAASKAGGDIRGVLEKASFKNAQDLEVEKKYSESAQVFESFAKNNPKSSLAIAAIFNAGVNYERAGLNGSAISSYKQLLESRDSSADNLKPKVRRLLAKQYQDAVQFEEAAKLYRQAAEENPKDPLTPNFIFNAAVLYEALGKSSEAIRSYTQFEKVSKKHSDKIDAAYSMAEIHRKAGQISAAISRYTEYVESGGDQEKVIESAYWISELSARQGAKTKSAEWSKKTLSIQKRFAPNKKGVGAKYAAKIKFDEAFATFKDMKSIIIPVNPNKQKAAAERKIAGLTRLTSELAEVIKYDSAEEIVSALSLLGEANQNMADAIINAPLPPGLNVEEKKQYKANVEGSAERFSSTAKESFKLAVTRGWELEVYNDSYRLAYDFMHKIDPKTYYNDGEYSSEIRLVNWIGQ